MNLINKNGLGHKTKMATMLIQYMAKTFTIIFFGARGSMSLELCMEHQGLKVFKVYINDDPSLTLINLKQCQIWSELLIVLIPDK